MIYSKKTAYIRGRRLKKGEKRKFSLYLKKNIILKKRGGAKISTFG